MRGQGEPGRGTRQTQGRTRQGGRTQGEEGNEAGKAGESKAEGRGGYTRRTT